MSGITLRQLEIFAQVVEHGSFRRCAEHLGVSQVSISEHVRELESRLGVSLFNRQPGGPSTLTEEGKRAHRRVVAILADINDLMLDVSGGPTGVTRRLVVAMPPFLMRYLQDSLAAFRAQHAQVDVKLDLRLATAAELTERINSREVDLGYFLSFDGESVPDSAVVKIEPLEIFVSRQHVLAKKTSVTSDDIRATPAIHLGADNMMRKLVDRALHQIHAGGSPLYLEVDEYGLILASTRAGHGFACMFRAAAEEVARSSDLVVVPLEHPLPALQVRRLMRHSGRHDALTHQLSETLTASLKA